jgi:hypothetical protein
MIPFDTTITTIRKYGHEAHLLTESNVIPQATKYYACSMNFGA